MLRTMRSPIPPASAASAGIAFLTAAEAATSAWRVIAPSVTALASALMPARSLMPPMSMTFEGFDSRSFIAAIRLWPPARTRASSSFEITFAASSTDFAFWYWNEYMGCLLGCLLHFAFLARAPDPLRHGGHLDVLHAERVGERFHHRRGRADRAGLAAALHAQGVVRAGRFLRAYLEGRDVVRARHAVVEIRAGDELPGMRVVVAALGQGLPDSLRKASVDLAFDDHRIDDPAEVGHRGEVHATPAHGVWI